MNQTRRILTGVKPTARPHIGNYLGAIKPSLDLCAENPGLLFVANLHALTTMRDGALIKQYTYEVAATWLALGLDPSRTTLFRQSDLPEVTQLSWILACYAGKGMADRAHAFKAATDKGEAVSMGLYTYPILMAADIIGYRTTHVPVGQDQKQHVEMARDIAQAFNHEHGPILTVPEPIIQEQVAVVPGTDGRKMSKSYGNTLPVFASSKELKKLVMAITTDSTPMEAPKDPDTSSIFQMYKLLASPEQTLELAEKYRGGNFGWGHAKQYLLDLLLQRFQKPYEHFQYLMSHTDELEDIFAAGRKHAGDILHEQLDEVRSALGL